MLDVFHVAWQLLFQIQSINLNCVCARARETKTGINKRFSCAQQSHARNNGTYKMPPANIYMCIYHCGLMFGELPMNNNNNVVMQMI